MDDYSDDFVPAEHRHEEPSYEPPEEPPERVNPWIAVLYRPRAAMRYVLDTNPRQHIFLIPLVVILSGLPSSVISLFGQGEY